MSARWHLGMPDDLRRVERVRDLVGRWNDLVHTTAVRVGAEADGPKKSNWAVAIVVGLMVGLVALSPGARTYYKTGKLPG